MMATSEDTSSLGTEPKPSDVLIHVFEANVYSDTLNVFLESHPTCTLWAFVWWQGGASTSASL